jgi:hypothetical protein
MAQIILVGIGAGLAAALLFASPIGGTSLALPLFAVTGMPIAIAGLGWTPIAGIVAAATGSAAILVAVSPVAAAVFLFLFAAPTAWLAYLAGLCRQSGDGQEWFPLGRLLVHAATAAAVGLLVIGYMTGFNPERMTGEMADALSEWMASQPNLDPVPSRDEIEPFVRLNVAVLPYTLAALTLIILVFDVWLASLVTRTSRRLFRPRERLWTVSLPIGAALTLVVASIASFLPFPLGDIAALAAGALGGAFLLLGLAVLHALTIGMNGRAALLTINYIVLFLLGFTAILVIALGLGETLFHLRARRFGGAPPP